LQNAIAFDDACFSVGLAFGEWITQECLRTKYFLRAVSMDFNLGDQLYRIDRYDEAIEKLKNVLTLASRWHYISGMIDWYRPRTHERLSLTLRKIGEYQAALSHLESFGQVAQSSRERALYYMGRGFAAQAQGDYEKSEQEYLKAIIAAKGDLHKGQEDLANVWYSHVNLAELFLEYNLPEKSLRYLDEGKFYAERKQKDFFNNERMSKYLLLKAQALIKKNDSMAAAETLKQAEHFLTFVNSSGLSIDDVVATAALYESLNEIEEARSHLKQAVNICRQRGLFLEEMRVILKQAELSMQVQTGAVKSAYPLEELYQIIAQLKKIGDKPQLIRAHALLAEAAYKANQHEEARRQANLLLEQTEALSRQYEREERLTFFQHSIYKDIKASIQIDILDGRLDSALVKLSYVKGRALRGKLLGSGMPYLDIAAAQKNLPNNEAILDYMITADTLYAFVLTRSALQLRRLPVNKQQLQAKVDRYISYLKDDQPLWVANNERHFRELFLKGIQLSNELYQVIFEKIAPALKDVNRLFIIPDEFLYAVPFNTLALKNAIDTRFLIESKTILVLPGTWMLARQMDGKTARKEGGFLVSIDPSLPGAEKIEKRLRMKFGNRFDARAQWEDKQSFKKHLATGDHTTYLFYAHAEANWDEPRESYIELPINSPTDNDRLSYQDIDSLDWRKAKLVILAGCETSGNRIYLGAGLAGLQRAFLAAGANQVLATYWKVDATQVADQIPRFLEAWNQHHDALLALQSMQKMAIAELKNDPFFKFPHLQLWGAYNLTGDKSSVGDMLNLAAN
jgi:CHAT domain-containing protein